MYMSGEEYDLLSEKKNRPAAPQMPPFCRVPTETAVKLTAGLHPRAVSGVRFPFCAARRSPGEAETNMT